MKILSKNQIKKIDKFYLEKEDISSIELMERAAKSCYYWILHHFPSIKKVIFLVGKGKNGGDGLALAKMLFQKGIIINIYIINISNNFSNEFIINKKKILRYGIKIKNIYEGDIFPLFFQKKKYILIDAIFGIGLNRIINNIYWKNFFKFINKNKFLSVISIDIPSGLFIEKHQKEFIIIKATHTLTFQFPKIPFFLPDYADYIGSWNLLDIGYKKNITDNISVKNFYIDKNYIQYIYKKRKKFSHKGDYGHGLLIGGHYGMIGAMILSAKASFKIGIGKLSIYTPKCGYNILQNSIPEAIIKTDINNYFISNIPNNLPKYLKIKSIGIGMGIGKNPKTIYALETFLLKNKKLPPIVIDADAINIISTKLKILDYLPKNNTIITPHVKEFYRLCGAWKNDYQKLDKLKKISNKYKIFIVLKGPHTVISTPNGNLYFNSTGNPGMATAGSGDVLSGIITGLLSQGYSPKNSCILGVYLHGLSGDIASKELNEESIMANDIINYIGKSYKKIK
ncbi:NAD(P)H-hydrate dehydratase [Blattabacterium cuenoti]|uniref:NAD(P)H-hydrate dehydratase n=1 Tax=Blattabacterium cuenoti TaxID=1653831 RepID=UPI00163CCC76|nr:NAD(P)H-hydrate dehydratase [Blattabacterium cuenoti]